MWKQKFLQVFHFTPSLSQPSVSIHQENTSTFINLEPSVEEENNSEEIPVYPDIENDFPAADQAINVQVHIEEENNSDDIPEIFDIENDLPPDYQDVIDSDLPDYHSLKM